MDALTGGDLFLFEGFRLDRRARALSRRDAAGAFVPIAVGSRALEVLDVLVGRAGDLVSRDEFMSAVWPETVVEETNLNVQIAALRRILDQGRADSSCIQTIPGRGYRFAAPVTRVESSTRLTSGRLSGNGAGGPIAEPPAPPNPATPSHSETARPMVRPRELKGLLLGSLAIVAGALFLVAAVVTASNWHPPLSGVAGPAPRLSIVVLPFTNLGDDRDRQNLANAMTENLTAELSLNSDLLVTSRNTAFTYGNKLLDTRQIGRALSVRYVVEGSVQRSGNQLRVNAQLIDAETDTQLWAERFDRDTGDLFALQSEIASQLANAIGVELIATEAARPTENLDALNYILRGRAERLKPNSPDVYAKAISLFEHALALDPQSVEAQTWLAHSLAGRVLDQMTASAAADITRAEGLVNRVLAARPRSPLVHFVKGNVLRLQGRCEQAIPEYETALALNGSSVVALNGLAWCKIYAGSPDEAIPLENEVIRLSPRDPAIGWRYLVIGTVHLLQSRTDQAIVWLEKARSAIPAAPAAHGRLAAAYALEGEPERAAAELAEARRVSRDERHPSIARLRDSYWGGPKARALAEDTLFAGYRKAGMPEE